MFVCWKWCLWWLAPFLGESGEGGFWAVMIVGLFIFACVHVKELGGGVTGNLSMVMPCMDSIGYGDAFVYCLSYVT